MKAARGIGGAHIERSAIRQGHGLGNGEPGARANRQARRLQTRRLWYNGMLRENDRGTQEDPMSDEFLTMGRAVLAAQTFSALLGLRMDAFTPGLVTLALPLQPAH